MGDFDRRAFAREATVYGTIPIMTRLNQYAVSTEIDDKLREAAFQDELRSARARCV